MRSYWLLLALGACTEPAIEMSLGMPQSIPADYKVDCVTSIEVVAFGEQRGDIDTPPDNKGDCLPVSLSTFGDIRSSMRDKFTLDIPGSGLVGIGIRGFAGACGDGDFHEGIFYGGAEATGDAIKIPLVANLSCSARGKIANVHPVDMLALSSTKLCSQISVGHIFAADFRPVMMGDDLPAMTLEGGSSSSQQWRAGTASIETFTHAASPQTCVAVGYENVGDLGGSRCIEDNQPTVCAAAGEVELPIIPLDYIYQSRDAALVEQYGEPVIGAIWETGTAAAKVAVANATVTLDDPSQGTVVYVDKGPTRFAGRTGATSTNTDGFFMVYLKGAPTTITVSSPLHNSIKYKVATSEDYPTTLFAALTRR